MGQPRHQREQQLGSTGTYATLDRGIADNRASQCSSRSGHGAMRTEAAAPGAMAHPLGNTSSKDLER
jgi:hypothetical protein